MKKKEKTCKCRRWKA